MYGGGLFVRTLGDDHLRFGRGVPDHSLSATSRECREMRQSALNLVRRNLGTIAPHLGHAANSGRNC
jgi:hypothetical protein